MKVRLHWTTSITENRSAEFVLEDLPVGIRNQLEGLIEEEDGEIPIDQVVDLEYEEPDMDTPLADREEGDPYSAGVENRYVTGVEFLPEVVSRARIIGASIDHDGIGSISSSRIDDLEDRAEELRESRQISGEW